MELAVYSIAAATIAIVFVAVLCSIVQEIIDDLFEPKDLEDYHLEPYVSDNPIQDLYEETLREGL